MRTFLAAMKSSEYHSLTQHERVAVVETIVDVLPSEACVLAGVGGATGDARELIQSDNAISDDEAGVDDSGDGYSGVDEYRAITSSCPRDL